MLVLTPRVVVGVVGMSETVVGCYGTGHIAERQLESVRTSHIIRSLEVRVRN
jgi:hypothetical protein